VPSTRALGQALLIALARLLTSLSCLWSGFRAVSDDDYSRVVIAARFAQHPSLDPSGTSWLPAPFWLYGVPMALFGDSLLTARAVALVAGALSAVLVWLSARTLGLSERAAWWGALGAVVLPYGAWLSAAMVPEAPTAALVLFGVVSLGRPETKLRALGGLALGAACFCRYEAWAPALAFAALTAVEAVRARRRALWLAVALAALPIGLWLVHGLVRHGDAFFFVTRVSQYRAALGREPHGLGPALLQVGLSIVRFEPELFVVTAVALGLSWRGRESPFGPTAWRPLTALGALVLFLVAADATGGSATHHPERSLLPLFWFMALLAAGLLVQLAEAERAWRVPVLALPLAFGASLLLRPDVRKTFVDRRDEEQVGGVLRSLKAERVALDTDDFGFFAVQAALGAGKSWALSEHDPRQSEPPRPTTSDELARRLRQHSGARWLVTPREREALALPLGKLRLTTPRFSLLELAPATATATAPLPLPAAH
jgi:hypothetical protein